MLAILPVIPFCLWLCFFLRRGFGHRQSLIFASIPCALFGVYVTELLSVFHAVNRWSLAAAWTLWAALSGIIATRQRKAEVPSGSEKATISAPLDIWDRAALCIAFGIVTIVALTAIVAAPNVSDSMQYHLPRVVQWIGNGSVHNYPTIDRQQLGMPPMAEFAMLHLNLLYGTDKLVNLIQWLGYVGSILCVTLLVKELGGDRKTQLFSAVLTTTLPTLLLGASGPKNDNVLTYWIVVTVYLMLMWSRKQSWWMVFAIGASGSLAAFTKGTAYTLIPFLLLGCWMIWDGRARRRFAVALPVFALILVSVCGPLWMRNHQMAGSILGLSYFDGGGDEEARRYANSGLSPAQAFAGVVRNISLESSLPSDKANNILTHAFRKMIQAVGVDPDDPHQMTHLQTGAPIPFFVRWTYRDEILSANQWIFILFLLACVVYLFSYRKMRKDWGWLAFGALGSFALYSALLRWAPWNARYHLPVLAIGAAFVALVLSRVWPRVAIRVTMFVLLLASLPLALMNDMRPWLNKHGKPDALLTMSRDEVYFLDGHSHFAASSIKAAHSATVKACKSIGVDATILHYEYPVMAMIRNDDPSHTFQYLAIENRTTEYANPAAPSVCAVVCLGCTGSTEKLQRYGANAVVETFGESMVFSNGGSAVIGGSASTIARH
jgi:4-amino-4-deoxy-L-arabinose transferase-like glycosyltransferase